MGCLVALAIAVIALAACAEGLPDASAPAPTLQAEGSPAAEPSASAPRSSGDASEPAWEILEPAPVERLEMATAAHDGEIWLVGGLNSEGSATDETWRFDPANSAWSEGPRVDRPIHTRPSSPPATTST